MRGYLSYIFRGALIVLGLYSTSLISDTDKGRFMLKLNSCGSSLEILDIISDPIASNFKIEKNGRLSDGGVLDIKLNGITKEEEYNHGTSFYFDTNCLLGTSIYDFVNRFTTQDDRAAILKLWSKRTANNQSKLHFLLRIYHFDDAYLIYTVEFSDGVLTHFGAMEPDTRGKKR